MKKIFKFIIELVIVLLLFLAVVEIAFVLMKDENGVTHLGSYTLIPIRDDNMEPTINVDDLIIDRDVSTPTKIQENDVITYSTINNGQREVKTGRVISVINSNGSIAWRVRGDNQGETSTSTVLSNDLIGQFTNTKMLFAGGVLAFAESQNGFMICIIVPLALIFIIQIFKLLHTLITNKKESKEEKKEENEVKTEDKPIKDIPVQPQSENSIMESQKDELAAPIVVSDPINKEPDIVEDKNETNQDMNQEIPEVKLEKNNPEETTIEHTITTPAVNENIPQNFSEPKVESIKVEDEKINNNNKVLQEVDYATNKDNTNINKSATDDDIEIL